MPRKLVKMDDFFVIVMLVLFPSLWFFVFYYMNRNHKVGRFRLSIINSIHVACQSDLAAHRPWMWRYEIFRQGPTYDQMLWSLRPLVASEWYDDLNFITPYENEVRPNG